MIINTIIRKPHYDFGEYILDEINNNKKCYLIRRQN